MKAWAELHQFGTMLEAVRTAARERGVELVELQTAVARTAVREGIVRPLPVFSSPEEMAAADAAVGLAPGGLPVVD